MALSGIRFVFRRKGRRGDLLKHDAFFGRRRRPTPVRDFGHVFAMFRNVSFVALHRFGKTLRGFIGDALQTRHAANGIEREPEAIHAIEHDHIERRGRRSLFDIAADVNVAVIAPAIREAMNQRRVAVEREDDRLIGGEERIEIFIGEPVRMFAHAVAAS